MSVDWEALLTVDATTVAKLFVSHPVATLPKLQIRGFSITFTGTQQRLEELIVYLRRQLIKYVFPENERPDDIDWAMARDKFGDIDPENDGKLGEMLLYIFVEAALKTPLMAYKLKDLGNPNDQVKGADGVFVGDYAGHPSVLVGESKIHKTLRSAVQSTLESLQRFHDQSAPYTNELLIARKYPAERGLDPTMLEVVDNLLNSQVDRLLVHPVFISYDCAVVADVCQKATCSNDAEQALAACFVDEAKAWAKEIDAHRSAYAKPFQVYLDFFFLPCEDSLRLRHAFYELLHGHPYESGAVRAAIKRVKKETVAKSKPIVAPRARAAGSNK